MDKIETIIGELPVDLSLFDFRDMLVMNLSRRDYHKYCSSPQTVLMISLASRIN